MRAIQEPWSSLLLFQCMYVGQGGFRPTCVWMVAPVVIFIFSSGLVSVKSNCLSSTAIAVTASMSANWSPTHFRGPPLNGM